MIAHHLKILEFLRLKESEIAICTHTRTDEYVCQLIQYV
jgi:hypothetical protein